jgi:DNA-directed RNA polymerase II subunit RPB2
MDNTTIWKVINQLFEDNPQTLVRHHIESYNDFFKQGIFQIFKENNPINIQTRYDKTIDDYRSKCIMYLGGKDGKKVYFGKPIIYDDNNGHFMYPNEARLRNMTYGITVHYDVDIEFIDILEDGESPTLVGSEDIIIEEQDDDIEKENSTTEGGARTVANRKNRVKRNLMELTPAEKALYKEATEKSIDEKNRQIRKMTLEQIFLGRFPIMLQSNHCILSGLPKEVRHTMGECSNDYGGYFIIDGKEKTVVSQEKFGDNMLYIREVNDDTYLYSAEIRSVSENVSKPIRTLSVKIMAPTSKFTFKNIVVNIPNVRKPVPLFIVFRALGFISDKQIITMCLLDLDKHADMVDLFIPSVHDAGGILTQRNALKYIATLTKGKTVPHTLEILADYFLPHIGEMNFTQKAYYLGYIVFQLLSVYIGTEIPTDRDNFKYKRIELVGSLMYDLFREYYTMQKKNIHLRFEEKIFFNQSIYADNLYGLIQQEHKAIFNERIVENGFKKAFKGNWGAQAHTKRIGVVQDLNRLSHNSMLSHLRKTNLPLDASVKVVGPRVLHNTQWGFFDPIDTPDGGNIGLHKHLSIGAYISQGYSRNIIIKWLREKVSMKLLEECTPSQLSSLTKIIINGFWAGALQDPVDSIKKIKLFRRNGLIPIYTSVTFEIKSNTIFMYTDAGRVCRPIFYRDDETGKMSYDNKIIKQYLDDNKFSWNELITGFNNKKIKDFNPNNYNMYELHELYENIDVETNPAKLNRFLQEKAVIDYIDTNETEGALIAMNKTELEKDKKHTHVEIHESLIFGTLCNLINFPENNPATRNSFSCGQSKQACSIYHTNHQVRMDKTAVVLNYAQNALVKSRYLKHINNEENPYGENAIVAVMCYNGYNVEDAILVNEGALKRGLFRTTYYSTYEMHEEKTQTGDSTVENIFSNIEDLHNVIGTKPGFDYSKLDKYGLVKENTELNDKTVLIGCVSSTSNNPDIKTDGSKTPKKGQLGIVDKTFITEGEEGTRIAKIRVREERIPNLGDKMASRAGQKGTVGLVIPERDMPFNKDGIRPDLIINPHALPSRMTIGQFVETITGKACAYYGGFGDCTAFNNEGSKIGIYGELLCKSGYHSSGNEVLYNGMTGEQLEVEIFMGPNYYMRLKHMVKDKINYRATGRMTALTKQPVSGRANDGGLRIGEMERDGVISHGASAFLKESMMERADKYRMAICNTTGLTAIYNPSKNIFLSPMADGPIKFSDTVDNNKTIETVSKFGRNFSIIDVPYSFKLLIQELQTMNVQMRIITEDNINQLETMTYSNNLSLLMKNEFSNPDTVNNVIKNILKDNEPLKMNTPDSIKTPENIIQDMMARETTVEDILNNDNSQNLQTPPYPGSPEGPPPIYNNSPVSVTQTPSQFSSPGYNPNTPSVSPGYNPNSPYVPSGNTPDFAPSGNSPDFAPSYNTPEYPPDSHDYLNDNIEYNMGDYVHFRGDMNPKRVWSIKNIGDKFITIETEDTVGLDSSDRIKVVTQNDIYQMGDFTYSSPNIGPIYDKPVIPTNDTDVKIGENNSTPAINIKIVNGNDMTEASSMQIDTDNIESTSNSNNNLPTPIKMKSSISNTDEKPIENEIDFKKDIVIKKI